MTIARINFVGNVVIDQEEYAKLCETTGDRVTYSSMCLLDNEVTQFYEWCHTYDPERAGKIEGESRVRKLVSPSEMVQLDGTREYVVDLDVFLKRHPALKISIRGMMPLVQTQQGDMIEAMFDIQKKFDRALAAFDKQVEFNQKCEVHVSNLGLLHINQLGYLVDGCTERLQDLLNEGWRIIACCVQSDQRRPDYVLGRWNPDETGQISSVKFK